MSILSLKNIVKDYHNHRAVDGVSFDVEKQKIFGLLGPNGAGKTSLIRIITSITGADSGEIYLDGELLNGYHPKYIGYMPEERGLYKKMKVGEQLLYLAQLKGLELKEAKQKLDYWLKKFEITEWWHKKVEELSKGMQQKVQFIATVVHDPKLIILDEPFTGLDPLNTNLIKAEIKNLKDKGCSIIFSTHRMEQVEEICEDIVLMNAGKVILEGSVETVKQQFKENKYTIQFEGHTPNFETFHVVEKNARNIVVQLRSGENGNDLLRHAVSQDCIITGFNEVLPSLNDIFIKQIEG